MGRVAGQERWSRIYRPPPRLPTVAKNEETFMKTKTSLQAGFLRDKGMQHNETLVRDGGTRRGSQVK